MADVNVLALELRTIIRKEVDFIPGAWVDFYSDITTGIARKAQISQQSNNLDTNLELVLSQIADWNFADNEGQHLPVTSESLDKLSLKLLTWISTAQVEILTSQEEDKKKLPKS